MSSLLLLIALLFAAAELRAQGPGDEIENSAGTLYVVAFPDTTKNSFDARYPNQAYVDKAILFIYSAVDTKVTVKGSGYNSSFTTTGGSFRTVELMGGSGISAARPIVIDHCTPVNHTFRIESDSPIIVYQYLVTKFGTEAWTPLPVEAWGHEYFAAAMPGEIGQDISPGGEFDYNHKNKMFPAEILVIAAYDDTRITIVPNGQVHTECRVDSIVLRAGEAFQIQSFVDTLTANAGDAQPDFGGSRIISTKPVGVISGNTRAMLIDEGIGLGGNIFRNMQIEALAPVEQWGTEFVYMPTWDARRPTGAPGEDPSEKRKGEFVRVYAKEAGTNGFFMQNGVPIPYDAELGTGDVQQVRHTPNLARAHRVDKPAQAMMNSAAVVKYAGTTQGFGGYIGAAYDGWGGYMVELTPREQWASFAPYYASSHPGGMEHFINVVVDTSHMNDVYLKNGSRFVFQRRIEGTDLIWGSMSVQQGIDHYLEGRNGARFAGYVYGGLTKGGHEEYRPGVVRDRRDDDPSAVANRGGQTGDDAQPLHPSEYEEYLAIAYGYPLAPLRLTVRNGDSLRITTVSDCSGTCVTIEALNPDPDGLRSVRLDNAVNAKIVSQDPFPITSAVRATVCITPINPLQDASATVVIKDMTGKVTRVPFTYYAERVDLDKTVLNFGLMTAGTRATLSFRITNPLGRAVVIEKAELIHRNPAFTVKSPTSFPITLAPGDTLRVVIEANPASPDQSYGDTVFVKLSCTDVKIPVWVETTDPCVQIGDLDFGTMQVGQSAARPLRISNDGGGIVTFNNPSGGDVLEWIQSMFTVSAPDLVRLAAARLARGEYIDVTVTFSATEPGVFRDTARLWASVRKCRDISYWVARVGDPVAAPRELSVSTALEAIHPNPTDGATTLRYSLARAGRATIVLYDERGARVATLLDAERGIGTHTVVVDAAALAPGVYHVRLDVDGAGYSRAFVRK
jgi:hypothetical protein